MKRLLTIAAAALALAGCGAADQSSAEKFRGDERQVADQVEELQSAGKGRKAEDICSDILSRQLVDELEAAGANCADEMKKAIEDSDEFELEVRDVSVQGNEATARVQQGDDGPQTTMEFVRENGQWRATSLNAG
jgi:outer membrane lipoprotein SlyB